MASSEDDATGVDNESRTLQGFDSNLQPVYEEGAPEVDDDDEHENDVQREPAHPPVVLSQICSNVDYRVRHPPRDSDGVDSSEEPTSPSSPDAEARPLAPESLVRTDPHVDKIWSRWDDTMAKLLESTERVLHMQKRVEEEQRGRVKAERALVEHQIESLARERQSFQREVEAYRSNQANTHAIPSPSSDEDSTPPSEAGNISTTRPETSVSTTPVYTSAGVASISTSTVASACLSGARLATYSVPIHASTSEFPQYVPWGQVYAPNYTLSSNVATYPSIGQHAPVPHPNAPRRPHAPVPNRIADGQRASLPNMPPASGLSSFEAGVRNPRQPSVYPPDTNSYAVPNPRMTPAYNPSATAGFTPSSRPRSTPLNQMPTPTYQFGYAYGSNAPPNPVQVVGPSASTALASGPTYSCFAASNTAPVVGPNAPYACMPGPVYSSSAAPNPYMQPASDGSYAQMAHAQQHIPQLSAFRPQEHRRIYDLPTFDGRAEDWPMLFHSYHSTTEAYGYSDLENLMRLQKCLVGDAKRTVQHVLIHPQHVGQVMSTLEAAFGRPEQLVRSQIQTARQLPTIDDAHLEQMGPFAIAVRNLAMFLDTEASQQHLANPTLLDELVGKLPMSRRLDWAGVASRIDPYPTIKDFSRWLTEVARLVSLVMLPTLPSAPTNTRSSSSRSSAAKQQHQATILNVQSEDESHSESCCLCSQSHAIRDCGQFLNLATDDRWKKVTSHQLCFCCLQAGHILPSCPNKAKCTADGCSLWHSPLLHAETAIKPKRTSSRRTQPSTGNSEKQERRNEAAPTTVQPEKKATNVSSVHQPAAAQAQPTVETPPIVTAPVVTPDTSTTDDNVPDETVLNCRQGAGFVPLLFRVVPVVLHGQDRQMTTYALLDEGSSVTLLDADVADLLKLDGPTDELQVQWFGQQSSVESSRRVSLAISGINTGDQRHQLKVQTVKKLKLPTQTVDPIALRNIYPHLRDIPFAAYSGAEPKVLIGLDNHHLGVPITVVADDDYYGIVAARTRLGWVVYGSDSRRTPPLSPVVLHVSCDNNMESTNSYRELDQLVRSYYSTEEFGVKRPDSAIESEDVKRARGILQSTTRRNGERFETGLLWRCDDVKLPDSYPMALRRLCGIEAKMRRDSEFSALYNAQITSYVQKGYARKLSQEECEHRDDKTWYLPHFAIQNPNKPGKFRLVFDAAATVRGVSLNSALLTGPDENVPLTRILFRFRLGLVGICADIREMFHQVRIRAEDQQSQRFLWRNGDPSVPPDTYVMEVMTFGSTCSPASAQYVKNLNALEHQDETPAAAIAIQKSHYVDDYVASFDTPADAIAVTKAVVNIHSRGGFELRGFVSSSRCVIEALGVATDLEAHVNLEAGNATEKVLGMSWNTANDTFGFQTRFSRVNPDIIEGRRRPTKREILSVTMSVFDPFGLLADFMLAAKILLQDLWRLDVLWDDPVPDAIDERWQAWRSQIERTRLCQVPRCYSPFIKTTLDLQLHVFADASEEAFAAVAFWRVKVGDQVQLAFVAGKTRCAPVKEMTVPRLELQAALLATRLLNEVRESHELQITRVVMWTDSQTVLQWIRSKQRKYKQFVAFRVAEITESAAVSLWRWCPTDLNVADDATRVKAQPTFNPDGRWIWGPAWLREDESTWPTQTFYSPGETCPDEVRGNFVGVTVLLRLIKANRFMKFTWLCRSAAWVLRFVNNTRARGNGCSRTKGELNANEMAKATRVVCRAVQREFYADEYFTLENGREIPQASSLFGLKPYLDEEGLIRLHGRTDNADALSNDAKRQILMPREHRVTQMLVQHHHERNAHQMENATIAAVRQLFWVPQLRVLVRSIRQNCQACKIRTAKPSPQSLGQLPPDRLTPYVRPFTNTGLDYFGPVEVTIGRRREKRWVALFTCLAIRAVHLEIASDLSTDACLVCIRNLCNLRGVPARIRCDNGTNFVGARNELLKDGGFLDPETMQREMSVRGIEWVFNCPSNPEAGGAWERLVQSVKRVLAVTLKEQAPRVETLRALLLEAANLLNSRPLTHIPVDPDDDEPITPNHFLIGGANAATTPDTTDAATMHTRRQWKLCKGLARRFWDQWIRDYLPELTRRSKHYPEVAQLKTGDLVIICDGNLPRERWTRGRVLATTTGRDGTVRTAEIQTTKGVLRRPVTRLALIDVSLPN